MPSKEEVNCDKCVAACCRAHTGLQLTKHEVSLHHNYMDLKCVVKPESYERAYLIPGEEWRDGKRYRVDVPMTIKPYHGLYLLLEDCGYLDGNDCSIHESNRRPATCREFEAGSTPCLMARTAFKELIEEHDLSLEELETRYESQITLEGRLAEIFAPRDEIYLPSIRDRVSDLLVKESFLGKGIRKQETHPEISRRAGTVYSWLACVARKAEVSIQTALESKFPAECAYCGVMPCVCQDATRGKANLSYSTDENAPKSLRAWQKHLDTMYGANNRSPDKGVWFAIFRMIDETNEIMMLELNKEQDAYDAETLKQKLKLEIADATAWLIAVCNLMYIDLQRAILEHYGNGCPKCDGIPCQCGEHYFSVDSIGPK